MPVFNAQKYLNQSLNSIVNQYFEDIEIILVNDASTDNSLKIMKNFVSSDERITLINFKKSKSSNMARKTAVLKSTGEYILFVDADDTINLDTCSILYQKITELNVDILQFGVNVIDCVGKPQIVNLLKKRLSELNINKKDCDTLLDEYFSEVRTGHLWGKLMKRSVVLKAFELIPDIAIYRAQDLLAFFLILYNSRSFATITDVYYNYFYGRGHFGKKEDFNLFKAKCDAIIVKDFINNFYYTNRNTDNKINIKEENILKINEELLNQIIPSLLKKGNTEYIDFFIENYNGVSVLINSFSRKLWYERIQIVELLQDVKLFLAKEIECRQARVIATYYPSIRNGGAQRVVANLVQIWQNQGYKVVLFTDLEPTDEDYFADCERIILPDAEATGGQNYYLRREILYHELKKHAVDTFVYHSWLSPCLLFDMLTIKSAKIYFILHCHNVFNLLANNLLQMHFSLPHIFSLSDKIITLSRVDLTYWQNYNKNVVLTVNPCVFKTEHINIVNNFDCPTILFICRFSPEKRILDAIKIMQKVNEIRPDIKIIFVGEFCDKNIEKQSKELVNTAYINCEFTGFTLEIQKYYEQANLLLCTSKYEGDPLTFAEAQCFGLPILSYNLPYLETLRNKLGVVTVPQKAIDKSAEKILELFSDNKEELKKLSEEAQAASVLRESNNLGLLWKNIFENNTETYIPTHEDYKILFDTIKQTNIESLEARKRFK